MLKVYKKEEKEEEEEDTDLQGDIKIHPRDEEEMELKMPGSQVKEGERPMIQEISSSKPTASKKAAAKKKAGAEKPKPVFTWEKAERVDAEYTFIN